VELANSVHCSSAVQQHQTAARHFRFTRAFRLTKCIAFGLLFCNERRTAGEGILL